jgi:hypothetical protein
MLQIAMSGRGLGTRSWSGNWSVVVTYIELSWVVDEGMEVGKRRRLSEACPGGLGGQDSSISNERSEPVVFAPSVFS